MPISPNFKGKKGRSGRKSLKQEYSREEMVVKALGKWAKAIRSMDDLTPAQLDRYNKLIMPIVSKAMPTEFKGEKGLFQLIINGNKDDKSSQVPE